jgi:opacity protein-like surface antigen
MTKGTRSGRARGAAARRVAGSIAVSFAGLAFALAPAEARAQQRSGRPAKPISMIVETGAVFVHEPGFGHGLKYGIGVLFKTARRAAFEIVLERFGVPVDEGAGRDESGAGGLAAGRMTLTSVVFIQHVYVLTRGAIRPFATVGVGYDLFGFKPDDPVAPPERDIVDRMALQFGGGTDIRLTDRLALTGRVRYNMAKTWITDLPQPDPIREVDPLAQHGIHLYGLGFSLGLKATF